MTLEIPREIFSPAELLARRLGISFNELLAAAVSEFLERSEKSEVTERLNEVYAAEGSSIDPALATLQYQTLAEQFRSLRKKRITGTPPQQNS